jgi:streptogramin lyase
MRRLLLSLLALVPLAATADCSSRLLVSGYFSNNVHVYDACSGAFERLLDDQGRLTGPQAIRRGPDGLVYVASEGTGKVLRYRADTLAFVDSFINESPNYHPLGLDFGPDGDLYVAGFDANKVNRYDGHNGQFKATVVTTANGIRGPEVGTVFGPDGRLYVPGYYTSNVVRYDPASGTVGDAIGATSGALKRPRGILFEPGGSTFLVGSENTGKIQRFRVADGGLVGPFGPFVSGVVGLSYGVDGSVLAVSDDSSVMALDPSSGDLRRTLVTSGSGGLNGATFAAVIPKAEGTLDTSQIGTQFWIIGAGRIEGKSIVIDAMGSGTGTHFGSGFNPAEMVRKRWGSLRIDFTGCSTGQMHWDSTGADSAGFGAGGYPLSRLLPSNYTNRCEAAGFANTIDSDWMTGHWWGGEARSGEGFMIEIAANGIAIVAWFTHRPL